MSSQAEFQNAQSMREQTQKALSMQQSVDSIEECKRAITRESTMGRNSAKCHKNVFGTYATQYFEQLGFVLKPKPDSDLVKVSWSNAMKEKNEKDKNEKDREEYVRRHIFKSTWDPDYWTLDESLPDVKCENW